MPINNRRLLFHGFRENRYLSPDPTAEDRLVNRVPELKQLSEDIDKATNTFINATLELESAIQQYQRAEAKLGGAVTTISKKVDTINQHIDKVLENAPTKLKVSVNVNDADWQKIQELFAKERQWITSQDAGAYP